MTAGLLTTGLVASLTAVVRLSGELIFFGASILRTAASRAALCFFLESADAQAAAELADSARLPVTPLTLAAETEVPATEYCMLPKVMMLPPGAMASTEAARLA